MSRSHRQSLPDYWIPQDLKEVLLKNVEPYTGITKKSEEFLNVLSKLKNVEKVELSERHYLQLLKLGLYLEEFQHHTDLQKYNLNGKRIELVEVDLVKKLKIHIKDFDKDHPVHSCNLIIVSKAIKGAARRKFILKVIEYRDNHVIAVAFPEFYKAHTANARYNIRFQYNNYSFRCSHYALSLINLHAMTSYLFPTRREVKIETQNNETQWFNRAISDNSEQRQAVLNIKSKSAFPAPYILYGPPGTGKTSTLVEAICQIWKETPSNVLICTPSNAAADVIAKRLLNYIPEGGINRIYSLSRDSSLIDDSIKRCSNCAPDGRILKLNGMYVSSKRITITTLCTCTKLLFLDLKIRFSFVFIDEAGQSTEPETLIAFNVLSQYSSLTCQIIISGDPQQLGPSVRSKYAAPILGQSLLERLMKLDPYAKQNNNQYDADYITMLLRNYRSHPAIIRVSNELYYDNELIACGNGTDFLNKDIPSGFPVIFHAVDGKEKKIGNSTSSYNSAEIKEVLKYVNLLIGEKIGSKVIRMEDIGIVTPFALQSKTLQKTLKEQKLEDVAVGTVEIFQGQEKEVIILSAVRSRKFVHNEREHVGFLSNPKRFNVALTRAKAVLVVVGNPAALKVDKNWRYFLKFCRDNGACRGIRFDLPAEKLDEQLDEQEDRKLTVQSLDLFNESFDILNIDDGVLKNQKNYQINSLIRRQEYLYQNCIIL